MAEDVILSPEDDRFLRAGEYMLGVLEGDELTAARRETMSDPAFADVVDWWATRFGLLAEEAGEILPRDSVWPAVEQRIDASDSGDTGTATIMPPRSSKVAGWSLAMAAGGAGLAAAALALFLATPRTTPIAVPDPAPQQRSAQLIAQLSDDSGEITLAGVIDPATEQMALLISGFEPGPDQSPELWVVPDGGAPVSLGLIPVSGRLERDLTAAESRLLIEGAVVAVTLEQRDGIPHAAPSTPILVAGPLDRV